MAPSTCGSDAIGGLAAALLAAGVLVAGPGVAVAVGDPGPRHSHSRDGRDSSDRDGRGGRDGGNSQRDGRDGHGRSERGQSERDRSERDQRRDDRDDRRGDGSGGTDDSAGGDRRSDGDWVPSGPGDVPTPEASAPEPAVAAPTARVAARAPVAGEAPQSPSVSAEETPSFASEATEEAGGGGGGANQDVDAPVSPRVAVGNGRVPGEGSTDRVEPPVEPAPIISSDVEPPAPVVAPAEPPAVLPLLAPISPVDQSSWAAPPLMTAPSATVGISAMWGLAGLILAPLAGIWLGYRQARANRAADELTSSLAGG